MKCQRGREKINAGNSVIELVRANHALRSASDFIHDTLEKMRAPPYGQRKAFQNYQSSRLYIEFFVGNCTKITNVFLVYYKTTSKYKFCRIFQRFSKGFGIEKRNKDLVS